MELELEGKRALVTGSSSGIGAGVAKILAAEGASIVVHGRDVKRTEEVAAGINASGGQAAVVTGDLATDEGAEEVARKAQKAFGSIDILVNNAGGRITGGRKTGLFQLNPDHWLQTYQMNLMAAVRLINILVPKMTGSGWGRVINISSMAAFAPSGGMGDYAAAKAAMSNLTVTLSRSLARTGVTANTISPGMVETAAFASVLAGVQERQGFGSDREKAVQWLTDNVLRQTVSRLGQPEDIGFAIAMLASPRGDFITGANIRVDGGAGPSVN